MLRLRLRFARAAELRFISHLDIIRLWQRAFYRADLPLAFSEGFNPHPRLAIAAPLPLGIIGEAELMDVFLSRPVSPHFFMSSVARQLPKGMDISQVCQVPMEAPALQALVRQAEYIVLLEKADRQQLGQAIDKLLKISGLPWEHQRDTGIKHYDLRALIDDLWLEDDLDGHTDIGMRLLCGSSGAGRPEQVLLALGITDSPLEIRRRRLILQT